MFARAVDEQNARAVQKGKNKKLQLRLFPDRLPEPTDTRTLFFTPGKRTEKVCNLGEKKARTLHFYKRPNLSHFCEKSEKTLVRFF